jgi:hypothetical protein
MMRLSGRAQVRQRKLNSKLGWWIYHAMDSNLKKGVCKMMTIGDFLNQNSGVLATLFSSLVATATIVYAVLTWKLVSETRKLREAQTLPEVFVTIQPREQWINFIDLIIQNVGSGLAYDINLEVNPDFEYINGRFLSEIGLFKNGLRQLGPNQKLQFFLTSLSEDFEKKTSMPFKIRISYRDSGGKAYQNTFVIDFASLIGLTQLGKSPMYRIADDIEQIKRDIQQLSFGTRKIKAIIYKEEEIQEKQKKLLEGLGNSRSKTVD